MQALNLGSNSLKQPRKLHLTCATFASVVVLVYLASCGVESDSKTGGTNEQEGNCGRGIVVVGTDYVSTNVSLMSFDGAVLSSSFISSASTTSELSTPLGGDVALSTARNEGDSIVILDRYPAAVLTWVDIQSGTPSGQLSVTTGFRSNPRDYLEISPSKAYVTRYDSNLEQGQQQFDEGGDVLIIDPLTRSIKGRIPLESAIDDAPEGCSPNPDKMLSVGSSVAVLLGAYLDYFSSASSRIVRLNPSLDTIEETLVLEGMHSCTAMALSPSKKEIAVSCSGDYGSDSAARMAESGIVLVSAEDGWVEKRRFPAASFGLGPVGDGIAYVSEDTLVFTTQGSFPSETSSQEEDAFLVINTHSGDFKTLLRSDGMPFSLGGVRCAPECGVCFLADAERSGGVVHRFEVEPDGTFGTGTEIVVDSAIGLPPRGLGVF